MAAMSIVFCVSWDGVKTKNTYLQVIYMVIYFQRLGNAG